MNILIIEDDQMLRKALSHFLLETANTVTSAANGQEALEAITHNKDVDVILCDVLMPEVSGPTFLLKIKRQFNGKLPKIVIISGVREGEAFLHQLEIPFDYFLEKPIDIQKLKALLTEIKQSLPAR